MEQKRSRTKFVPKGTENVGKDLFLIEQKMFAMKIAPN